MHSLHARRAWRLFAEDAFDNRDDAMSQNPSRQPAGAMITMPSRAGSERVVRAANRPWSQRFQLLLNTKSKMALDRKLAPRRRLEAVRVPRRNTLVCQLFRA